MSKNRSMRRGDKETYWVLASARHALQLERCRETQASLSAKAWAGIVSVSMENRGYGAILPLPLTCFVLYEELAFVALPRNAGYVVIKQDSKCKEAVKLSFSNETSMEKGCFMCSNSGTYYLKLFAHYWDAEQWIISRHALLTNDACCHITFAPYDFNDFFDIESGPVDSDTTPEE